MESAFYGASAAGFLIAAAFFLRFWGRARKLILLIFSIAFALLALSFTLLAISPSPQETDSFVYLIRLLAFTLIIGGIVWTNTGGRTASKSTVAPTE
jgi:hypothetical protein